MFRIPQLSESDSLEEKRRTRENVVSNFIVFTILVASIRLTPYIMNLY